MKRLLRAGGLFVVLFALAQLIRPERANPPTDPARAFAAHAGATAEVTAILDRSCGDCHSNNTEWRWYSKVAPTSWLMARAVSHGRQVVNFSEWASYPPETQRTLLTRSCETAAAGKMPGPYAWVQPGSRLSPRDIEALCAAAKHEANAGDRRPPLQSP